MSFDFQRNNSSFGIGDIFVNRGQMGQTAFVDTLGANLSQLASDFLGDIRYRYYIEPDSATRVFTLGQIGTEVSVGYSVYIKNTSTTQVLDVNEGSTNTLLVSIEPGKIYKTIAQQAGTPDLWIFIDFTQEFPENFVYVDPVFGYPPTEARVNRLDLPFLTLNDANTASGVLGAVTFFVRPGNYSVSSTLNKANASWYCPGGVNIVNNASSLFASDADVFGSANITGSGALFTSNSTGTVVLNNVDTLTIDKITGIFVANQLTDVVFTVASLSDVIININRLTGSRFVINDGKTVIKTHDVFIDDPVLNFIEVPATVSNTGLVLDANIIDLGTNGNGFSFGTLFEASIKINKLIAGDSAGHIFNTSFSVLTLFIDNAQIGTGLINGFGNIAVNNLEISATATGLNVFDLTADCYVYFNQITCVSNNNIFVPNNQFSLMGNNATIGAGVFISQTNGATTNVLMNSIDIGNALFLSHSVGDFYISINSITNSSSVNRFIDSNTSSSYTGSLYFNKADVFVSTSFVRVSAPSATFNCAFNKYIDLNANGGTIFDVLDSDLIVSGNDIETATDTANSIFNIRGFANMEAYVGFINTTAPILRTQFIATLRNLSLFTEESVSTGSNAILLDLGTDLNNYNFGGRFLSGGTNTPIVVTGNTGTHVIRFIRTSLIAQGGLPTEYLLYNGLATLTVEHQGNTCSQVVSGGTGTITAVGTLVNNVNFT